MLSFEHKDVVLPSINEAQFLQFAPVPGRPDVWLGLDRDGSLHEIDLSQTKTAVVATIDSNALNLAGELDLHVATQGRFAALAETRGRRAVILDPSTGRTVMALERDGYHLEHCRFPLAFFEHEGRLLVVHATQWNRLEISDPSDGRLLTPRDPMSAQFGSRHEHFVDYFHGRLTVSPTGERVVDDGWCWGSSGVPRAFSLRRWLEQNPYESEDGPSMKDLFIGEHLEREVCWLDDRTLAIWGQDDDDGNTSPGVAIHDAETGELLRSFAGPARQLVFDSPYLVAFDRDTGASLWDPLSGERLLQDPAVVPDSYHPTSRRFLTRRPHGLRLSRMVDA